MSTLKKSRFDPWHLSQTTLWTNKSSPYVSPWPGGWVGEGVHPAGISGVKRQFPNHSNGHHLFRHESRRSGAMKVMFLAYKTRPCPTTTLQSTRMSHMTPQHPLSTFAQGGHFVAFAIMMMHATIPYYPEIQILFDSRN